MHEQLNIVLILTIGLGLASLLSYLMQWIRLPTILGYLIAGYFIGPYSPGFVADTMAAEQLAEIGVILMLFGVGMHFKVEHLMAVKNIAVPGAIVQTLVATLVSAGITYASGLSFENGVVIGLSVGVASTVVLMRILTDYSLLNTLQGHIAIGWLIVEDIMTVVILVLLPAFADFFHGTNPSLLGVFTSIGLMLIKFAILGVFMFTWGQRIVAYLLTAVARLRVHELFTVAVLALVFIIAVVSSLIFGTSMALGAFIAGMVIGKSQVKHQAAANALPFKDLFVVIFFLSAGMLFNPVAIVTNFPLFIGIIGVILIVKPLIAYFIAFGSGYSVKVALTVAISLAQIGEFSFILSEEAMNLKLLPDEGFDIIVACALISIALNPLLFQSIDFFESRLRKLDFIKGPKRGLTHPLPATSQRPKAIIVGFGPIGKAVFALMKNLNYDVIVIDQNIDTAVEQEKIGKEIIFGDASELTILNEVAIDQASFLIVTIPETEKTMQIIEAARPLNPTIQIITRVQYISEKSLMRNLDVTYVCSEAETLHAFVSAVQRVC